jgi:DNA invertase Pin-like site-specific DNA recombinase
VIAYLRVSTDEQGQSGAGMDAQRADIEAEIARRPWTDVDWIAEIASAADLERPGIQRALDRLSSGSANVLVVSKLDRLSRSLIDFAGLMKKSQKQDWSLIALDLGIYRSTPQGEMMAGVLATFSQFERRLISQRTSGLARTSAPEHSRPGRLPYER